MKSRTYDCENPVDPSEATSVVNNETHKERTTRRAKSAKKSPHADVSGPLLLEESLGYNTRASTSRRTDEECGESSADSHGSIRVALGTSDVESKRSKGADEPYRSATVAVGDWFPEQGSPAKDGDLK